MAECEDLTVWKKAVREFGDLQVQLISRVDEMVTSGCPLVDLTSYGDQVSSIIEGEQWHVDGEEFGPLQNRVDEIEKMSRTLADSRVPVSLDHGDLGPWQIILAEQPCFRDCSDSCLTHPFLSLFLFFDYLEGVRANGRESIKQLLSDEATIRQELTLSYLAAWQDYGTEVDLVAEFEVAQSLGPIHVALKFARLLSHGFDSQWDLAGSVPQYLKKFIEQSETPS